jgi:hypothetical protein
MFSSSSSSAPLVPHKVEITNSLFSMWEVEIGTDRGQLSPRKHFARKIDPIVNGISKMDAFNPVETVQTNQPTVVMLSNIQFIKGIKPAILAADIIVNKMGFKDYQLHIYGAKDRQPSYCAEVIKLIQEYRLGENVLLKGFGKPDEVLRDAWIFMNSSISEGLPLAIGEAALAGVPIVATEVGATALVLTDPEKEGTRYGEVVPPNDPSALARAQISLLAMVGPWAAFTETKEACPLPEDVGPGEAGWLSRRMVEKMEDRRKLGLLSRGVVIKSFNGRRYIREHEQMYWIQWYLAQMRGDASLVNTSRFRFGARPEWTYWDGTNVGGEEAEDGAPRDKWHGFGGVATPTAEKRRTVLRKKRAGGAAPPAVAEEARLQVAEHALLPIADYFKRYSPMTPGGAESDLEGGGGSSGGEWLSIELHRPSREDPVRPSLDRVARRSADGRRLAPGQFRRTLQKPDRPDSGLSGHRERLSRAWTETM